MYFRGPGAMSYQPLQAMLQARQPVHRLWSKKNPYCVIASSR